MPELPEVEVVVRGLRPHITGKKFKKIEIRKEKLTNFSVAEFAALLSDQEISKVERIGKMIVIYLEDKVLVFHLKMTGQLVYENIFMGGHTASPQDALLNRFTHLIFTFEDNTRLCFNDQRLFGYCHLIDVDELDIYAKKYGIDPIQTAFEWDDFWKLVQKHPRMNFKTFLLNQKYVAGLGNIYVDEVAFMSGIDPRHSLKDISKQRWKVVHAHIPKVLQKSIAFNGTTFSSFLNSAGNEGNFRQFLKVYGKKGEPCENCGSKLQKIKLAGRGTVYCQKCQV